MTTSTRTTFTASPDGPIITVEQRVSQSVARRALRQIEAVKQPANAPALAAPGGLVQRPGGEPLTPRANQATGATPVGSQVQYNQGIATGQPLVGGETPYESLPVGWQVGEGDPTAVGVVARYAEDRYLDESTLTLYYWQQLVGQAAEWVAVTQPSGPQVGTARPTPNLIDAGNEATNVLSRYPQDRYFQSTTRQTWQWVTAVGGAAGYWDVAAEMDILPVGVESPAVQQYPALFANDLRRRVENLWLSNYLPDGSAGVGGSATLIASGAPATLGETVIGPGEYLLLNVTNAGTGMLIATIELRQV